VFLIGLQHLHEETLGNKAGKTLKKDREQPDYKSGIMIPNFS
jgi:hypothetical protein